jgi:hypothetical protein
MAISNHTWLFAPHFRKNAFGWRSDTAITRIKEALTEIRAVTRKDARLGADGAVLFLQKLSRSLQNIDSSSGVIGSAVDRAIDVLVPLIAKAPADEPTRRKWLDIRDSEQKIPEKVVRYLPILQDGWELDNQAWIVQMVDGSLFAYTTNHGYPCVLDAKYALENATRPDTARMRLHTQLF